MCESTKHIHNETNIYLLTLFFECISVNLKRNHNDSKLGLSLSNIRLGLCVVNVKRHSEAEYAGVIPGSVLVSINGVGLLCEMSVSAIGVVWMLEHCPI